MCVTGFLIVVNLGYRRSPVHNQLVVAVFGYGSPADIVTFWLFAGIKLKLDFGKIRRFKQFIYGTHLLESFSAEFDKFEARKAELLKKAAVSKAESDELEKLSGRYAAAVAKLSIKKAADSVGNFLDGLLGN